MDEDLIHIVVCNSYVGNDLVCYRVLNAYYSKKEAEDRVIRENQIDKKTNHVYKIEHCYLKKGNKS